MCVFCRCASEGLMKSSDSVITTMVDVESVPLADLSSTVTTLESQKSSVSSEVFRSNPLVHQCAQVSFSATSELPAKQTSNLRHVELCSFAQPEHIPPLSRNPAMTNSIAHCNGCSSSGASSLFIDEIISNSKGKNRAPSIEVSFSRNVH